MDFRTQRSQRRLMILMDALSIVLAMVFAFLAHDVLREHFTVFKDPPAIEQYALVAALTIPMMLGFSVLFGLHRHLEQQFSMWGVVFGQARLLFVSLLAIALVIFLTQVPLNRSVVGLFLGFTFAIAVGSRLTLHKLRRRSHARRNDRHHLLLVANNALLVERVIDSARAEDMPPEFVGIVHAGEFPPVADVAYVTVLGGLESLRRILHEETVDEVVLATANLTSEQFTKVLLACDELGMPMRQIVLPDFHDGRRLGLERRYGLPFVTLACSQPSIEDLILKRAIDLAGSIVALLILAPVLLAIATAILVTMGRPVLFSQERIGYHGRRFQMHKFRSMVNGAEQQRDSLDSLNEMDGPTFKIAKDPRITPLGRFLRKFSLDELPQLYNVLTGTMSLVGPRPLPVAEQRLIEGPMRRRLSMKPGCTGLWQVSGRSNVSFDEWMRLDLEYVDNFSPWLDLKLLLKTIPAVLAGRGAS